MMIPPLWSVTWAGAFFGFYVTFSRIVSDKSLHDLHR